MKKIIFILSILILFSSTLALSEHKKQSIELYPYISQEAFDSSTFLQDTLLYGIRIGFNFSKKMQGEFLYSNGETDAEPYKISFVRLIPNAEEEVGQVVHEEDEISIWGFNFIFNFKTPKDNLVPYAIAGLGRFRIVREFSVFDLEQRVFIDKNPTTSNSIPLRDSQSSHSFTLGGGLRSYLSKRIALRFELRAIQYKHGASGLTFNVVRDPDGTFDYEKSEYAFKLTDDDFLNYEVSLGLSFLFGGK